VLAVAGGRATPAGIFVAPGSLGLGAGLWLGPTSLPLWPCILCAVATLAFTVRLRLPGPGEAVGPPVSLAFGKSRLLWSGALCLLLFSVAIRGFVESSGCHGCAKLPVLAAGLPLVGFTAKLLGGFVADRLGWRRATTAALLVSAPPIAFADGSMLMALGGLLLFQMTMPVTLAAVFLLFPKKPATAFGFPCLALIAGVFMASQPWARHLLGASALLGTIAASAMAILSALEMLRTQERSSRP
jgi:FSR family fosmidomycin resistance protein-like MFS transporter